MATRNRFTRSGKVALLLPALAGAGLAMADSGTLSFTPVITDTTSDSPTSSGLAGTVDLGALVSNYIAAGGLSNNEYFVNTGGPDASDAIRVLASGSAGAKSASSVPSAPVAAASLAVPSLTGGTHSAAAAGAIAQATTIGVSGDGKPDFEYNPLTGDVVFRNDGGPLLTTGGQPSFISSLTIASSSGKLLFTNVRGAFNQGSGVTKNANLLASALTNPPGFTDGETNADSQTGLAEFYDLGLILPAGLNPTQLTADLTVKYQVLNGGALKAGDVTVPEPASLGLIGVTAAGLLARRRAKRA